MSRPTPGPDLLTLIEQAREATRELRAALKDVKDARRDAEEAITRLMQDAVVDALDTIVKREVQVMGDQFQQATQAATKRVAEVCNQLYENYMRGANRTNVPISEVMEAKRTLERFYAERGHADGKEAPLANP